MTKETQNDFQRLLSTFISTTNIQIEILVITLYEGIHILILLIIILFKQYVRYTIILYPITENELEDENQSEIPQKRQKCDDQQRGSGRDSRRMTFSSDFKRFLSPGETELDIEKFAKDVNESKAYDVSDTLKLD